MPNNIFMEAKQLLNTKPVSEMTRDEISTVTAATIPLNILPQFNDLTTDQGLEVLSKLWDNVDKE